MRALRFVVLVVVLALLSGYALADGTVATSPRLVKFSGTLANSRSTTGVTFAIYAAQTGGAPLWLETQNVTVDEKGRFTIYLGANHAEGVPIELFPSGEARWLGVQTEGQPEQPRVLLVAVPYALHSANADMLGGLPASAYVLAPSTVSSGGNYVNSATVAQAAYAISGAVTNAVPKFSNAAGDMTSSAIYEANGNLGIGTSSPARSLHIKSASPNIRIEDTHFANSFWELQQSAYMDDWFGFLRYDTSLGGLQAVPAKSLIISNEGKFGFGISDVYNKMSERVNIGAGNLKLWGASGSDGIIFPDGTKQTTAYTGQTGATYTAGAGLTLNGNQFSVNFGGTGVAATAARSDHNHDANYVSLGGSYTNPAWIASIAASKISGQVADTQIASVSAMKVTGTLTASQISGVAAVVSANNNFTADQTVPNLIATNNVSAAAAVIGGDTPLSSAPRMFLNAVFPGAMDTNWTAAHIVPDKPITITRVTFNLKAAATSGCNPQPQIQVTDGIRSVVLPLGGTPTAYDTGAMTLPFAAGADVTVKAVGTCPTSYAPQSGNMEVEYRMGNAGDLITCSGSSLKCGSTCTDYKYDVNNCGACGTACPTTLTNGVGACNSGTCGIGVCNTGYGNCDGNAANGCESYLPADPINCGNCGNVCSYANATAGCVNSSCAISACNAGWGNCDSMASNGCETNILTSINNCGGCAQACSSVNGTPMCAAGNCSIFCNAGFADCDNNARANGCETNIQTSVANCGACGQACSNTNGTASCAAGACAIACNSGYANCDQNARANGCEVNLASDPNHCGSCTTVCPTGDICSNGQCSCPAGRSICGSACVDLVSDPAHCGNCNTVCMTGGICSSGQCSCPAGRSICGNACIDTTSDPNNCGTCGHVCGAGGTCSAGTCSYPVSCNQLHQQQPSLTSGTYFINPGNGVIQANCDMTTNGGGYTMVVHTWLSGRYPDTVNLNTGSFTEGFAAWASTGVNGNAPPNSATTNYQYVMGLEAMRQLASHSTTLRFQTDSSITLAELTNFGMNNLYGFTTGTGSNIATVKAAVCNSASSCFLNAPGFTTTDGDHDNYAGGNCAAVGSNVGFWYDNCYFSNPFRTDTANYFAGYSTDPATTHWTWWMK